MKREELLQLSPYGLPHAEKKKLYEEALTELTEFHRHGCPAYGRFLDVCGCRRGGRFLFQEDGGLEDEKLTDTIPLENIPFLPVSVFKEMDLVSVPEDQVVTKLTSSGTSGQRPSSIALDAGTSAAQQIALARIVGDFIGEGRIPYLVLDSRKVLKDRRLFSARGAGILGFSVFASRTCYALDENMELDIDAVKEFLEKYQDKKILLFGFTFMIWKHVVQELERRGVTLPVKDGFLIHGGGWKKLQSEAVSPEEFARRVRGVLGPVTISNYYGMAEQTGSIYMECECGHLHASTWSDILIRRPEDYSLCETGEKGIIQVLSPLAGSYPGHSLLTEDQGMILGEDDCPCGRKGKYFRILGRIPRAEVRGCSDTYEG